VRAGVRNPSTKLVAVSDRLSRRCRSLDRQWRLRLLAHTLPGVGLHAEPNSMVVAHSSPPSRVQSSQPVRNPSTKLLAVSDRLSRRCRCTDRQWRLRLLAHTLPGVGLHAEPNSMVVAHSSPPSRVQSSQPVRNASTKLVAVSDRLSRRCRSPDRQWRLRLLAHTLPGVGLHAEPNSMVVAHSSPPSRVQSSQPGRNPSTKLLAVSDRLSRRCRSPDRQWLREEDTASCVTTSPCSLQTQKPPGRAGESQRSSSPQ
jgi:hypothetical protein